MEIIAHIPPETPPEPIPGQETPEQLSDTVSETPILLISRFSEQFGVDFALASYLAKIESNYDPRAKNPTSTAAGVYQFTEATWRDKCEDDVFNASDNIRCALRLIAQGELWRWTIDETIRRKLEEAGFIHDRVVAEK
jgi:soluble lytic murein transglycosylase-like protein